MNKLSVYNPPEKEVPPSTLDTEVCLKLTLTTLGSNGTGVLLEIVDPKTGVHAVAGNLMNIYPDGTYSIIPGAQFGSNTKRGFSNRNRS